MVPPPSNPQEVQQFLSSVLSQRGPNSSPYDESTKWLLRQHLLDLITSHPSLTLKTATSHSLNHLQADGTIPMIYHGVTYNIPVVIWLLESYPFHPPCVYVNPTPDMIIKQPHAHVNSSGLVSLPYLQNWVYPSSNLVYLVSELSAAFACDPPLYSRRLPDQSLSPYHQHVHHHHQKSDDVAEDVIDSWSWVRENQGMATSLVYLNLDLPVENAVYSIDKPFQDGVGPFDQYSRTMRWLSRDQFSTFPFLG
ncbi:unnamed protein product [Eruca vesicaria subsp. sativa]|uniref:UEV domain-containing protein n=1 Tax=Eruca vesicaria subsp. sativa TaxID=29727 RepID=A0ABC8KL30_ERUVS|nr:unnamed protein product [Eruca vesicaria subsp. sativa]